MTLEEWAALAAKQADTNLHEFNFRREQKYGLPILSTAYVAFADYLAAIAHADGLKADKLLAAFVSEQKVRAGATSDLRFSDPGLRNDSRQVFLKSLGIHETYLTRIGFDPAKVQAASGEIAAAISSHALNDELEAELQQTIEALAPLAADEAEQEALAYRANQGAPGTTPAADTYGKDPWWFTYEFALSDEERTLPDAAAPLLRSGYVAGMRAGLGLYHSTDADNDNVVAGRGHMAFRMYFQLATAIPDGHASSFNQPRLFSEGIPRLFLTNPKSDSGGRTVRLQLVGCTHDLDPCQCGHDGLPEGVMPAYVPMDGASERDVRGLYLILHRDLGRYEPPSCETIRAHRSSL